MSDCPPIDSVPSFDRPGALSALVEEGRFAEAVDYYFALPACGREQPMAQYLAAAATARLGRFVPATSLAEAAELGFKSAQSEADRLRALNLLGGLVFEQGEVTRAEGYFREVLAQGKPARDGFAYAHATTNLASIVDLRGDSDGALRLYYDALRFYQELGDLRGIAQIYHNLSIVFRKLGMWEASESVARQAVRYAETLGNAALMALCLTGQAEIRLDRRDLDGAEQCLLRAQLLASEATDHSSGAEVGRLLAQLNLKLGRIPECVAQAEISRSIAHRAGLTLVAAECAAVSAIGLTLEGSTGQAAERKDEAIRGFATMGADGLRESYDQAWIEACVQ